MNENVKAGEVLNLKELISYEKDSIVNLDIVSNEKMKFFLMAFDEGYRPGAPQGARYCAYHSPGGPRCCGI